MKTYSFVWAAILAGWVTGCDQDSRAGADSDAARLVYQVLATTPLVDGHNDLLIHFIDGDTLLRSSAYRLDGRAEGQTDIPRWRAGRIGASFITVDGTYNADIPAGLEAMLDLLDVLQAEYPNDLVLAKNSADILNAHAADRIALLPHIEDAGQLSGSVQELRTIHSRGVRSVGLTWNRSNHLADAAADTARWGGLSGKGEEFVRELNCLGMLIDLSHASDETVADVLRVSSAPVVLSHSSARSLVDLDRNVSDEILREIGARSGVVMVTFVPYFTTTGYAEWYARGEAVWDSLQTFHGPNASAAEAAMRAWEERYPPPPVELKDVADHFDHVRATAGIDYVGIGSDFDGMFSQVYGLEDVSTYPALLRELARRGWSADDLRKVAGENVLRALAEVERIAAASRCG